MELGSNQDCVHEQLSSLYNGMACSASGRVSPQGPVLQHVDKPKSPKLHLDLSEQHEPVLLPEVSTPQAICCTLTCLHHRGQCHTWMGQDKRSLSCPWTCLHYRDLYCTWTFLGHRGLRCTNTFLDIMSLIYSWTCLHPELLR